MSAAPPRLDVPFRGRLGLWLLHGAAFALVLAPLIFWRGGVLEEETISFIRGYLDGRPVSAQVLDPHRNDFGTYQARELSYLVDKLDAEAFRAWLRRGLIAFVNLSSFLAALATIFVFRTGVKTAFPALSEVTAMLALLVYVSGFAFSSTLGIFYRATKPLVALCLLAGLLVASLLCRREAERRRHAALASAAFSLALTACLLDRQGFYEVAVGAALAALAAGLGRPTRWLAGALGGAVALSIGYNVALGPWLIHRVNGYWPSFAYQRLPWRDLLSFEPFGKGAHVALMFVGGLLGSFPTPGTAVACLAVCLGLWRLGARDSSDAASGRNRPPRRWLVPTLVAAFFVSQVLMTTLMVVRHPLTYDWPEGWWWYFPLPLQAILLFGFVWWLGHQRLAERPRRERWIRMGCLAVVCVNVLGWPASRARMERGHWYGAIAPQARRLTESLRAGEAEPGLEGRYRKFYFFCLETSPAILARSRPQAGEGAGFYPSVTVAGRHLAPARRRVALHLLTAEAGRFRLVGELWTPRGSSVRAHLPDGRIETLAPTSLVEGPLSICIHLHLPAGPSELRLESEREEAGLVFEGVPLRGAFAALLPLRLEPE